MRLKGKRVLVTAAAQGIGRAVAEAFASEGAVVWACDINAAGLTGLQAETFALDVTDHAAVAALPRRLGDLDVLFNAAGVVHPGGVLDCSDEDWSQALELNLTAAFRLIRAVLPGMLAQGAGSIINTASVASSLIGVKNRFAYGATKAALIGMTKSIAVDYVAQGIRINAICPGTVETPSLLQRIRAQAEATGQSYEDTYAAFAARQPVGRLGRPEEIAALAVYLASDESAFTIGTTAVIDGGWTAE